MKTDTLFIGRTPEAAAIQLATVLAYYAECELATLERLRMRKRVAKYDLERHESICSGLIRNCRELGVPPQGLYGRKCPRLEYAMATALPPSGGGDKHKEK